MKSTFQEFFIKGIVLKTETNLPLILMTGEHSEDFFSIPVGPAEASSIIVEVEGIRPPRPLTHDLLVEFFGRHGFTLLRVEIYEQIEENVFARIVYRKGIREYQMDVRPSDGIALSVRTGAPILIHESILQRSENRNEFIICETESEEILYLDPDLRVS